MKKDSQLGPYKIIEEIGRGGMAAVYRAYQPNMERDVAVKVIMKSLVGDNDSIHRFQREARLIARLEHPHILPVYDFDGRHDPPYIVMRYLHSGTLKHILSQGLLPLPEVSHLIQQVGSALDYAHRQGIIHRDIKPSNIMIDQEGHAFVTDFGLARMVSTGNEISQEITAAGSIIGTPIYMAPEQIAGEQVVDHRADIYSLGVILYQVLTGQLPYSAEKSFGLLAKHLHEPIPSAAIHNKELPPETDDLIKQVLAKNPEERFQTAADLAQAVASVFGVAPRGRTYYLRQAAGESITMRQVNSAETLTDSAESKTPSQQNKSITALYANAAEYAEIVDAAQGSEAARRAMNALWSAAEEKTQTHGGLIISRTDETILCIWGAEATREDDAERAIRAALDLQEALYHLGAIVLADDDEPMPLKIGINTGLALLTPSDESGSYSASGATISLANRLMQQAYGSILITHNTYSQVRGVFDVEPDMPLQLRRNREAIPVYSVTAAKPRAFRLNTRGVEGIETRMIGREAELKTLENAFLDAIEEEETQVVTIVSEAGLGKTRLLYEFSNWAELRPEKFWVFRGRATSEMTNRPYALLRDLLSYRFGILDNDVPKVVRQKLEQGVAQQIGANNEMAHLLGYLAGFDMSESAYVRGLLGDPVQLANRAKQLFKRWIIALADDSPLTIELEDIHLADSASLDLLNDLVSEQPELPILLICLARPSLYEQRPTWGSGQYFHSRLDLRPLDRRDSRALVREVLQKVDFVPKALRDLLVERSEGNPYYVEELIKMLIDDRVILKESADLWRVEEDRLGYLNVPATLVGLLQTRLDSLLYPEKLALQRAAVLGRVFYDDAIDAIGQEDDYQIDDLPAILNHLSEREFIFLRETTTFAGTKEYIFSGDMLREVLLSTLLRRQRESYNQAAAEWLIQNSGDRVDEYNGLIASYYEKAGDEEQAAYYLQRAGESALVISAYGQARELFERSIELLPSSADSRCVLLLRLGETFYYMGNYPKSRETFLTARLLTGGDDMRTADALYWLSQVYVISGDYVQAQEFLEKSMSLSMSGQASDTLARVLYGLGDLHWRQGDPKGACEILLKCLDMARQVEDMTLELNALNRLGTVYYDLNDHPNTQRYMEATLTRAQEIGNREREASALNNLGEFTKPRDLAKALAYYRRSLVISRELERQYGISLLLANIAEGHVRLGELDKARPILHEGLTLAQKVGAAPLMLILIQSAGLLFYQDGDQEKGLALIGLSIHHPATLADLQRTANELLGFLELDKDEGAVTADLEQGSVLNLEEEVSNLIAIL